MERSACLRLVLTALLLLGAPRITLAVTITVDTTTDEVETDGDCSLREAVQAANNNAAVDDCPAGSDTATDEIVVPAGTYTLTGAADEDFGASGDLDLFPNAAALDLIVTGAGPDTTIIQACTTDQKTAACPAGQGTRDRVFNGRGVAVTFRHLTIRNGGGALLIAGAYYGLGLAVGPVTFDDCVVADNASGTDGGAIYNFSDITIVGSTLRGNRSGNRGGGVFSEVALSVSASTFSGNYAVGAGGGIAVSSGAAEIVNSTFTGNQTGNVGGAISNTGSLTLANSTVVGNTASLTFDGRGGGVLLSGPLSIVRNSIIAGNTDQRATDKSPDCYAPGGVTSQGYNVVGIGTHCSGFVHASNGDQVGTAAAPLDARLQALADNGGPTLTHKPEPESPAVDGGNPALPGGQPPACAAVDQRGIERPQGTACDSGAIEITEVPEVFALDAIAPESGGNAGSVSAVLRGTAFVAGATAKLTRPGAADVVGIAPTVAGTGALLATFDLTGATPGTWNVVITNPDASTATLPDGFTIEAGGAPILWAEPLLPRRFRQGRQTTIYLSYGNRGNVNAFGVPLWISFPDDFLSALRFIVAPPPPHAGQPATDWTLVGITTRATDGPQRRSLPFVLPVVPAGFRGVLTLRLRPGADHPTGPFRLAFNIGPDPFFDPTLSVDVVTKIVTDAKARATNVLDATMLPDDATLAGYVSDQLASIRTLGMAELRSDLGQPKLYSMTHLLIDASQFAAAAGGGSFAAASAMPEPLVGPLASLRNWLTGAFFDSPAQARSLDPDCWGPPFYGECPEPDCRGFPEEGPCEPEDFPSCDDVGTFAPCDPGNPGDADPPPDLGGSQDPNDKVGPQGVQGIISGNSVLPYAVFFENVATATLPAQEVVITDQLDTATLDLATFALGAIGFGDTLVIPPPDLKTFTTDVDLRPAKDLLVRIEAGLDGATGLVTWRFTSLDPDTGELPEDPEAGFLPPNVTPPEGDASVLFTIAPKPALALGTVICNDARIVFDVNAPIDTPECCNTIGIPPEPEECENCLDDDGDGLVDRADDECAPPAHGAGAGVAPEHVKPLAKCTKALRKAGAKLTTSRLGAITKCLKAGADCVQLKSGDAVCLTAASGKCAKSFAAAASASDGLVAALTEQCQAAAAVVGPVAGLGFDAEAEACAARGVGTLAALADVGECVRRRQACTVDRVLEATVPRAAELLTLLGRNVATELPCLTGATSSDGALAAELRKPLRKCDGALQKAAAKLLTARQTGSQGCGAAVFACLQEKPGNAACLTKATKTCTSAVGKTPGLDAAFTSAVGKACGAPLAMSDLLAPTGLDAGTLALRCGRLGVPSLDGPTALATCVGRELACRADQLGAATTPRLRELRALGGVTP